MRKVIVIGCPGSGKSVFSRQLHAITGLPLYPLDLIRWRADKTFLPKEQMVEEVRKLVATDEWIIDGNYGATMELRMAHCDTIIFLDYPTEVCYEGIMARRGTARPDMPWVEPVDEVDPEFVDFVLQYNAVNRPIVLERIQKYADGREVYIFQGREEAAAFLDSVQTVSVPEK